MGKESDGNRLGTEVSQIWACRIAVSGLIVLLGCGGQTGTGPGAQGPLPPGYVAPTSTENLELVDHPEYVAWSRFAVGSGVVRRKGVSNEAGTVRVTTTVRLVEKTAEKVVVENQITVERPDQPRVENPAMKLEFPATFPLPRGMTQEQFSLPSMKAKQAGKEMRAVCGRDYQAEVFAWDERNEAGPMTVKYWRSDEIPGRMLRQEVSGRTQTSVEEVVEILGEPKG